MANQQIGKITHYFSNIGVGVIGLTDGSLGVGDMIKIEGHGVDFEQIVTSMQIDHQPVANAQAGQSVGLKTDQAVKEGDVVYKVED
ncbi:hypothetical protein HZA71_01105 [Candidatus Falkowbacteria bacterium]|nr:hypothetical protein [Candidatus Falkowbacteria bacterium]